jgi:F-box/TPR repeat protein Pof3
MKAIEAQKLAWITKWCTKLKELQMHGRGIIGESLTSALQNAKSLETLYVSRNTQITLSAVLTALKLCKGTLVTATFLNVQGYKGGFLYGRWEVMESIKTLRLEADGESCMDFVSATAHFYHFLRQES